MSKWKKEKRWASDDAADNLLAGVLDDMADAADEEQARLEAELTAREEERARRAAAQAAKKREAAEARIDAEVRRQDEISARRERKKQALRGEVASASDSAEPAVEDAPPVVAPAPTRSPEPSVIVAPIADEPLPTLPRSRSLSWAIAAAAIVIASLGGAFVAGGIRGGYTPDAQVYAKAVYVPKDARNMLVEKASLAIPAAAPEEEKTESAPATRQAKRPRRVRPTPRPERTRDTVGARANDRANRLQELLKNSADPFGLESK